MQLLYAKLLSSSFEKFDVAVEKGGGVEAAVGSDVGDPLVLWDSFLWLRLIKRKEVLDSEDTLIA